VPGTNKERTFLAIKPDGVDRGLVGKVIRAVEAEGLHLVGIKGAKPTREMAAKLYADSMQKPFFKDLLQYISGGAVIGLLVEGPQAVERGRAVVDRIRDDLVNPCNPQTNIVHGARHHAEAAMQSRVWFQPSEVLPSFTGKFGPKHAHRKLVATRHCDCDY